MKKLSRLESLMQNSGWVGITTRLTIVLIAVILMHFLPQIFTWASNNFLSEKIIIDESRHTIIMYLAYFILVMSILFEVANAIILFLRRKK